MVREYPEGFTSYHAVPFLDLTPAATTLSLSLPCTLPFTVPFLTLHLYKKGCYGK
jgi:hypothetical protein